MLDHSRQPPAGSTIEIVEDMDGMTYRWRAPGGGILRYAVALFLLVWLGGWMFGLVSAVGELRNGVQNGGQWFLVCWLVGWTVGGAFVFYILYRLLRTPSPELVTLRRDSLYYDSGALPMDNTLAFQAMQRSDSQAIMRRMWGKRQRIELDKQDLGPVTLERVGSHQRLSFDHGADRIEIGPFLREPEREWLAAEILAWQQRA